MSRLLENQAKELLREASTMAAGDVEGFAAVAFPIVRRVFGGLLANDLVSVQPMSLPSGLIFFLDFTKTNTRVGDVLVIPFTAVVLLVWNHWRCKLVRSQQREGSLQPKQWLLFTSFWWFSKWLQLRTIVASGAFDANGEFQLMTAKPSYCCWCCNYCCSGKRDLALRPRYRFWYTSFHHGVDVGEGIDTT
jgi:hypothetical protein